MLARIRVDNARMAGMFTYYAFLTHVETCEFYGCRIGIHSGSTNLRVTGSDFASNDIAAIMIDAGNAIEIDNCCIEGNSGIPIIVSGGPQGFAQQDTRPVSGPRQEPTAAVMTVS